MKNFVVYRSGAGSGKTFTLVKEYLRLALADEQRLHQNYRRILAVTFTNKAAAEMKSRVITTLSEMASGTPNAAGQLLSAELKISMAELQRRSQVVLSHLLHHYSDFAIGTIDSFTHKIVRTFAQELDLPANFNVEMDAASFYEKVVSELLSRVGEDEQVTRLLKEYVLTRAEDNAFWDPESNIQDFTHLLLKEDAPGHLSKLAHLDPAALEQIHRELRTFMDFYRSTVREGGSKALAFIGAHHLTDDDFTSKGTGPQSFFKKCARGQVTIEDARGARIAAAVSHGKWAGNGPGEKKVKEISPSLSQMAGELVQFIETNHRHFTLCELLSKQMYGLMLLQKIEEISRQQKQEERVVFISEFNNRIFNLISEEPTPFIYERLGEKYQHFLLDEFQDTSSLQWLNLLPLLDNSLSNGWYNLVVGDGKQSIYRWRNANVRQFAALPHISTGGKVSQQERENTLARNFEERILGVNYRSRSTIVNFNNSLFSHLLPLITAPDLMNIYASHEQQVRHETVGYITIQGGKLVREELEELNKNKTLQYIREALEDGYGYRDICVLGRTGGHGNAIADHLVRHNIPVVSSDSLLLKNNLEVNTLISYLRTLVNPRDQVSACAVIAYLKHAGIIPAEELDRLLKEITAGRTLPAVLEQCGLPITDQGELMNLSEHCVALARTLRMESRAPQYIRFFLDEVNEFLVQKKPGLDAFLDWWESRRDKASLIVPADTDAVRIMTIHASKGLEFPVLILPFCSWKVLREEQAWVEVRDEKVKLPVGVIRLNKKAEEADFGEDRQKEMQEQVVDNLNLLYVALTRAVDRLHVISARSSGQTGILVSDWLQDYLMVKEGLTGEYFEAGAREKKSGGHGKPQLPIFELEAMDFSNVTNAIRIKPAVTSAGGEGDARNYGILIHHLLSSVRTISDVEATVEKAFSTGMLGKDEQQDVQARLMKILQAVELSDSFEKGVTVKTEAEIVTAEGDILRPDRVTFKGDHCCIVDYKTGRQDLSRHGEQLRRYAKALTEMGHKNIKKLLVYLESGEVVEVK